MSQISITGLTSYRYWSRGKGLGTVFVDNECEL